VQVHAFRRDELLTFQVTLMGDRVPQVTLTVSDERKNSGRPSARK
jgi:predicted metalloprotease with PDZ domain